MVSATTFSLLQARLYTDRVAPPETRTSAQALVGLLTYGARNVGRQLRTGILGR